MQYTINTEAFQQVSFDNIPSDLKIFTQFVLWKSETRDGNPTKIPYRPDTFNRAATDDPSTWNTFVKTKGRYISHSQEYAGIGFVFTATDSFTGIDIDDCLDDEGELAGWAQPILDLFMPTYAEISPSGTGLKLWIEAAKDDSIWNGRCRKKQLEIYDRDRFFTLTGNTYHGSIPSIANRQQELNQLYQLWFQSEPQQPTTTREDLQPEAKLRTTLVEPQDEDILKKAVETDPKFHRLYIAGDISDYDSSSEADAGLCCKLAFWFQLNPQKIDIYFRQSALMRDKWNRTTYRNKTIEFAIQNSQSRDPNHQSKIILTNPLKPLQEQDTNLNPNDNPDTEQPSTTLLPKTDAFYRDAVIDIDKRNLLWCEGLARWYIWNQARWEEDDTREIYNRTDQLVTLFLKQSIKSTSQDERTAYWDLAKGCSSHARQKNIAEMMKSKLPVRISSLDQHDTLLNTKNGTVDLTTGQLLPHNQEHLITKLTNANYFSDAECPRWMQFLDEIMDNNANLTRFLQIALGYALFGDTSEHYLFVLHGTGRNGKSTLIDVLMYLLGDYAMPSAPDLLMNSGSSSHPTELADLRGARFVACIEAESTHSLKESLVKRLTGGDTIKARYMHQNFFAFKPTHTLFLATNRIPEVSGNDKGIWSRLKLIPFDVSFEGKEDKTLKRKLIAEEADGILSWAVKGAIQWYQHGLSFPDEITAASSRWKDDSDLLGRFIEERCAEAELFEAKSSEIYRAYKQFCEESGERSESANKFSTLMIEKGYEKKVRNTGKYWLRIKVSDGTQMEAGFKEENDVISFRKN